MKTKIGKKIKIFWDIHKVEILFWAGLAVTATTAVAVGSHINKKHELKLQEEAIERERKHNEVVAEAERLQKEWEGDPLNTVSSGGAIADYYDCSYKQYDMASFTINDIPISSMGDFGKNIVAISKERFPEFGEFDTAQMILELRHSEQLKEDETDGEH